jgi:hypothetical protein
MVGRYIMANDADSQAFVDQEWAFMRGLTGAAPGRFEDTQYYWDSPITYKYTRHNIDAVNLAYTLGHANVHRIATDSGGPDRGRVYIPSSLPKDGYGPNGGSQLAYWILGGCSTPIDFSAADRHLAFAPWWQVFNGLHAVVGYRTLAHLNYDSAGKVGAALGKGQSVVHGWMDTMLPSGKTSAVTVCGHDGDNAFRVENVGRPSCLQIWWYA